MFAILNRFLLSEPKVGNFAFINIKHWSPHSVTIDDRDSHNVQNKIISSTAVDTVFEMAQDFFNKIYIKILEGEG